MTTTGQLGIAACIVASVTAYMAYVGTTSSWQYFLTVDECLREMPTLVHQRVRVSGKVEVGSLEITTERRKATFKLAGTEAALSVRYTGPLPDNLTENIEVVVEGRLDELGTLEGEKVLTKCASKYASEASLAAVSAQRPAEGPGR